MLTTITRRPLSRHVSRHLSIVAVAIAAAVPLVGRVAFAQPAPGTDAVGPNGTQDIPTSSYVFAGQVSADNTIIRSAPSENDYPVIKVNAGTLLNVVAKRDDWLKIEPPEGSFCLVSQAIVDKSGDGTTGKIVLNAATVRVGSALVPQKMTRTPVQLPVGSPVKILGEYQNEYYKIAPPQGVYLYVQKQFVVPLQRVTDQPGGVHTPGGITQPGNLAQPGNPSQPGETVPPPHNEAFGATGGQTGTAPTGNGGTTPAGAYGSSSPTSANRIDPSNRFEVSSDGRGALNGGVRLTGAPPTTAPVADAATIRSLQDRLSELEKQYMTAGTKPLAEQPLDELAKGYAELLADPALPPNATRVAQIRAQAIQLRKETLVADQQTKSDLAKAAEHQAELEQEQKELAARVAETAVKHYAAIGQLGTSSLQVDGKQMFRLIDPASKRTIIYVRSGSDDKVAIVNGLNQFIAINGQVVNDEAMHLTYVQPTAFDVVEPKQVNTKLFADFSPPSLAATNVAGTSGAEGQ